MTATPRPLRPYTIPGPAGALEVLYRPASTDVVQGAALVCHPHPLHGGTMHSRVVHHLSRGLAEAGFVTLRFNFRGAGQSEGVHDGGAGEMDDALVAFDHLGDIFGEPPSVIAGHSFGAWVGLRVGVGHPRRPRLVGAGLPVDRYDFSFLADSSSELLVIQGDQDSFGPIDLLQAAAAKWPPQAKLEILAGADHFFEDHLGLLREAIAGFFKQDQLSP
jgi:alpha/beta superfamily hydrolase